MAPLPKGKSGARVTAGVGHTHTISAQTTHEEASWDLVKFVAGDQAQEIVSRITGRQPITPEQNQKIWAPTVESTFNFKTADAFIKSMEFGRSTWPVSWAKGLLFRDSGLNDAITAMVNGEKKVGDVIPEANRRLQQMMETSGPRRRSRQGAPSGREGAVALQQRRHPGPGCRRRGAAGAGEGIPLPIPARATAPLRAGSQCPSPCRAPRRSICSCRAATRCKSALRAAWIRATKRAGDTLPSPGTRPSPPQRRLAPITASCPCSTRKPGCSRLRRVKAWKARKSPAESLIPSTRGSAARAATSSGERKWCVEGGML